MKKFKKLFLLFSISFWRQVYLLIASFLTGNVFAKTTLGRFGNNTDIVSKEMYSWIDQGGNSLTLRPEFTASVVRSYIQHQLGKQNKYYKCDGFGTLFLSDQSHKSQRVF